MSFKIYVTTLDEELLIAQTIGALLEVFSEEQIEVIDLGSSDRTLECIPAGVKVHDESLTDKIEAGKLYTELKNSYSRKQDWVLWVDGDEIYPKQTLEKIRDLMDDPGDEVMFRLYWRILKFEDDKHYASSEYLCAGPKLFHTDYFHFSRSWPREVVRCLTSHARSDYNRKARKSHHDKFNGLWFWHGVLLERSGVDERTARRKKRIGKIAIYDEAMTWERIDWCDLASQETKQDWTIVNPAAKTRTTGRLK